MTQFEFQKSPQEGSKNRPVRDRATKLAQIMATLLDEHELRMIGFQLGIDFYYLSGDGILEKTRTMVAVLAMQHRIHELIKTLLLQHPEIPWKKLLKLSRTPKWISWFSYSFIRLLPAVILIFMILALFAVIPLSSANWNEVLGISGEIFIGTWDDSNCTFSQGYWKEHPEAWQVEGITIGDTTYSKEDALSILDTPSRGDATYILAYQLMAAKLNIFNGSESGFVEQTILDADKWLVVNPLGSKPKNPEREVGISLAGVLEEYNNGMIGPRMCSDSGGGNISSIASYFELPATGNETSELGFSATPVGMLPELPGTPAAVDTPEQRKSTPDSYESEPPNSPEATQPGEPSQPAEPTQRIEPTQDAEPTQVYLHSPTPAPTMNPSDGLITTPGEGLIPTPTMAQSPDLSPTDPGLPEATPLPTPTIAPTAYSGAPGCAQPLGSWAEEPGTWLLDEFNFAAQVYDRASALEILVADPHGDATYILAKQYITAQLNIAAHADPTSILDLLDQVKIWFNIHTIGSAPKNPDRKEGLELAAILERYNLGLLGPGPCEIELPTPTSTPTPTPTSTSIPPTEDMDLPPLAPVSSPTPTLTSTLTLPTETSP